MQNGSKSFDLAWKLLFAPIIIHLLAGLSLLALPDLWVPYFTEFARTYPEVNDQLSNFMFALGLFHLLVAGTFLFVLSAYRKKARWAWLFFFVAITFGWGADFLLELRAGIDWAIYLTAAVILLAWFALGVSVIEFFPRLKVLISKR